MMLSITHFIDVEDIAFAIAGFDDQEMAAFARQMCEALFQEDEDRFEAFAKALAESAAKTIAENTAT